MTGEFFIAAAAFRAGITINEPHDEFGFATIWAVNFSNRILDIVSGRLVTPKQYSRGERVIDFHVGL